jgi:toxin FitB
VSGFLIGANVISDLIKVTPAHKVAAWVDAADEQLFHLSVVTLG